MEVDEGALRRNFRALADRAGAGSRLLPMLKADGYGVGAVRVARALADLDPWAWGVATVEEGAELRRAGREERIVVFSPCPPLDADRVVEAGLEPAVASLESLEAFGAAAPGRGELPVHLEVDTGMGRLGLVAEERDRWIPELRRLLAERPLELASTFTHFHSAESDRGATREQAAIFRSVVADLQEAGLDLGPLHLANSAALLRHPETVEGLARPGLYLYGGLGGEPVVSVRARVLEVREVPAGHTVSYGARFRTSRPARLATLGIGYGDGLRRELSEGGAALLAGRRVPIRGAVCMDVTVVDVTDVGGVEPGDVATVLGRDGGEELTLEEIAETCGTIPYEILTGLGRRLPRVDRRGAGGEGQEEDVA